jgi:hypothetical protein
MSIRTPQARRIPGLVLTAAVMELTLTTAYIHYSLGGLLFTLNAAGYAVLAASLALTAIYRDGSIGRWGWLPRLGLAGYTLVTIGSYLVMGPYFPLGWVAKAVEVAILTLLVADVALVYGSPRSLIGAAAASLRPGQPRPA